MLPARVLRLLATSYIFTEVSPDVFANNRLSSVLDTGKPVEELLAKLVPNLFTHNDELRIISPESKHIGTPGITSILGHLYDMLNGLSYGIYILICCYRLEEGFKSCSYLTETLLDPELGHAFESNKTAFNKAHNVEENMWTWLERPENRLRLAQVGAGMSGLKNISATDSILEGSVTLLRIYSTPMIPISCFIESRRIRMG
jgi:hypothetical protein